jgi:hypothetical protein
VTRVFGTALGLVRVWAFVRGVRRTGVAMAIFLGALLLLAATAGDAGARPAGRSPVGSASKETLVMKEHEYARFTVAGTNGYKVLVSTALDGFGAVHVIVSKGHSAVEYLAFDSRSNAEGVQANLAGLGHISFRFHPRAKSRRSALGIPRTCLPAGGPRDRLGLFTGNIVFHGEGGFTSVERTRASGDAGTIRMRCPKFHLFKRNRRHRRPPRSSRESQAENFLRVGGCSSLNSRSTAPT